MTKYETRIRWCQRLCPEKHCCGTCEHYKGGIEFIPFNLHLTCRARFGTYRDITLRGNGIPIIDGKEVKNCEHWKPFKEVCDVQTA